jgi:probable HAF family extracellular repeat protein
MRRFAILSTLVISLLISANAWGDAPPAYLVTDLGPGTATAINSSGEVAVNDNGQAYLYSQGSLTPPLGTLGGSYSNAFAVNDNGQVAGESTASDGAYHAFLYNGAMTDLGAGDYSYAYGINNAGQTVGQANNEAFLYSGGSITYLGSLGGDLSEARAVNASGTIAGWANTLGGPEQAFIYSGGSMRGLGGLPGGNGYSNALAINAGGELTGNAVNNLGNYEAFLYNGTMQGLGTLAGFANSWGIGINDFGEVVGKVSDPYGITQHAMLAVGGTMYDLNNQVVNLGGWSLSEAEGVNDSGAIVGFGTIGGVQHGFLLTPTPEPSTLVLTLLGAIGLGLYGWRGVRRG